MRNLRKTRINEIIREKYAETRLELNDFICPLFVVDGKKIKREVKNFDNVYHLSIDNILFEVDYLLKNKINKILLFGVIDRKFKDNYGSIAWNETDKNIVIKTIKAIKQRFPNLTIMIDVCMCGYTKHGHCGIIKNGIVDNDLTVEYLAKISVTYAKYGADYVAPSAMMDGQVFRIRQALDNNGFKNVKIMSYSAKYASNLYGPFRIAANSAPTFGNRKTYQMDYRNIKQAMKEIKIDVEEGTDIVLIKPANFYQDVICSAKRLFKKIPIAAYQVSGEYMAIKLLIKKRLAYEKDIIIESLTGIKRSGADYIISYFAKDLIKWLK